MEQISDKEIESQIKEFYRDNKKSFLLPNYFFQSPGGIYLVSPNEEEQENIKEFLQDRTVQDSLNNCKEKINDSVLKNTSDTKKYLKNLCL